MDVLQTTTALIGTLGCLAAHVWVGYRRNWSQLAVWVVLDLLVAVLVWGGAQDADLWSSWMQEDAWVEWSTFYGFALAGVLFLASVRRGTWLARLSALGLGVFCLFVAGEEISWGQRLFAFSPPEIFLHDNFQQEANLHNLLQQHTLLGLPLDSKTLVILIGLVYGSVVGLVGAGLHRRLGQWTAPFTLAPAFALVSLAELIYPLELTGEAAEFFLGMCFLGDAWLRFSASGQAARRWLGWMPVAVAGVVLLSVLTPPTLEHALYGSDQTRVAQTQLELQQIAADLARPDGVMSRMVRKRRVHKRIYTAVQSGYISFGQDSAFLDGMVSPGGDVVGPLRRDRQGYFLDPWQNAYWILRDRKQDTLVVYSFGPNRKRDSRMDPFSGWDGDDLGVAISLP